MLDCAAFGVADPNALRFLDPPPGPALAEARALLTGLHAIDATGRLTEAGEAMRKLALPARLAHMVAEAAKQGQAGMAAELAVLMTERGLGGDSVDLERRLARFRTERGARGDRREGSGRQAGEAGVARPCPQKGEGATAGALLLHAWPDRVAKARGERGKFLLANGSGAQLDAADPLAGEPFLVVADLQGKAQSARIASAAAVSEDDIRDMLGDRIETRTESAFDPAKRSVRVRETARLGAIVLAERMLPAPSGDAADRAILAAIREHGLSLLTWSKDAETLRHRLSWLHRGLGDPWPDVSDEALVASLEDWLLPFLGGKASFAAIDPGAVHSGLMSLVPHDLQRRIGALAPTHYDAPSGSRVPILYDGEWPVLAIRVQELFGLDRHPSIADGKVALTLELLSPAHRPIQTTRDLPGFWRGSWAEVRAEMRGRYPRHVVARRPACRGGDQPRQAAREMTAHFRVRPV